MSTEESLEVFPRYVSPKQEPVQVVQQLPKQASAADSVNGIFTTLYENKLIVFCVIVVILAIAFVAYFVLYKKDEPEPSVPAVPQAVLPPAPPVQPSPAPQPAPENPNPPPENTDLNALLEKSKNTPIKPPVTVSKSHEEIMALMEDATDSK